MRNEDDEDYEDDDEVNNGRKLCEVCAEPATMHCTDCNLAFYCSNECQLVANKRGHGACCAFHKFFTAHPAVREGCSPASLDNRVYAKTLPSFCAETTEELDVRIDMSIKLVACMKRITEHSVLALSISQLGQSTNYIAAVLGLCGTGGDPDEGIGEPLVRECLRLATKLSNAQLRFKNQNSGGAHTLVVLKPVRLDELNDTGARRTTRFLLIEKVAFLGSKAPSADASLIHVERMPKIPALTKRYAYELVPTFLGERVAPLLEVKPWSESGKLGLDVINVREDVPRLLSSGLLNAVFGGC